MKRLLASILCIILSPAVLSAQTTTAAPQRADVPAAKIDGKTGKPQQRFMQMHQEFLDRARQGEIDILFVGDSITQGWSGNGKEVWRDRYANRKAANFGIGGDRTQHVLWRMQNGELEGIKPKVAVVMIGTNNSKNDPAADIASGVEKIVKEIQARTGAKVLLLAVFPRGETPDSAADQRATIKQVNERIAKLDDGKTVRFLDLGDKFTQPALIGSPKSSCQYAVCRANGA